MKHYDDIELLERYYLPAPERDNRDHLDSCASCRHRLDSLTAGLEESAGEPERHTEAKPEFFWERQSVRIRERIERGARSHVFAHLVSIAATLVLLIGGSFLLYRAQERVMPLAPTTTTAVQSSSAVAPAGEETALQGFETTQDAWSSDQLQPYRGAVEWESWLASEQPVTGGQS